MTETCTCPITGVVNICSCGCGTCQDPCLSCPTWYWYLIGIGGGIIIILAIIGWIIKCRQKSQENDKNLEITLNSNDTSRKIQNK